MSGIAIGAVGLLVGVIIIGGVLYFLGPLDNGGSGPDSVATAIATSTTSVPDLPGASAQPPGTLVDRRPPAGDPGQCEAGDPCLRVAVNGPGSVSFILPDNVTEVSCPPTCEASFPAGRSVRIYRTRGLTEEQEQGARLAGWGAECAYVIADNEPRGGTCELTLDQDREASASFDVRPRLEIFMPGAAPGWFDLDYAPEQIFATAPRGHRLGCGNPPCTLNYFYDLGTAVTIEAGYDASPLAQTAATFEWGGACSGTAGWDRVTIGAPSNDGDPCTVTLTDDTSITMTFGLDP